MAILRNEQVLGLQVPVHDAMLVRRGEASGDLHRVVDGELGRKRASGKPATQGLALQKLCDGVGDAILRAEVEDRENVGMRQRSHGLGFPLEAGERRRTRAQVRGKDLDRDVAVEFAVAGAIDLAHAARAEPFEDLVGSEAHPAPEGLAGVRPGR